MNYELMWLVADSKKPELTNLINEIDTIVKKAGGTKVGESINFERKLAYEIKHNWRGIYVVSRFTTADKDARDEERGEDIEPADVVGQITTQLNLHKDVLRYIIVSADDLPSVADFVQSSSKSQSEGKKVLKEKGERIDGKLEKVLKI